MTKSVGVHEAKTHLSAILVEVAAGREVVITRRGHPVARIVPERRRRRVFGIDEGVFDVPDDFDDPLPDDVLERFP